MIQNDWALQTLYCCWCSNDRPLQTVDVDVDWLSALPTFCWCRSIGSKWLLLFFRHYIGVDVRGAEVPVLRSDLMTMVDTSESARIKLFKNVEVSLCTSNSSKTLKWAAHEQGCTHQTSRTMRWVPHQWICSHQSLKRLWNELVHRLVCLHQILQDHWGELAHQWVCSHQTLQECWGE